MAALPPTRITAPTGFHQGSPCSEIPVKSSLSAPTPPLGRAVCVDIWWRSVFRGGSGEEFPEGGRGSRDRQSPVHSRASPRTVDRGGHRPWGWGPGRGRPPPRTGWNSTGPSSRCPTPPGLRPPPPPPGGGGSAWRRASGKPRPGAALDPVLPRACPQALDRGNHRTLETGLPSPHQVAPRKPPPRSGAGASIWIEQPVQEMGS